MNNLKLREATRKLIKPCADCGGGGYYGDTYTGNYSDNCDYCKSKGYIDELEFGCEIMVANPMAKDSKRTVKKIVLKEYLGEVTTISVYLHQSVDRHYDFDILGKPLELNELLEALDKVDCWYHNNGMGEINGEKKIEKMVYGKIKEETLYFKIDLKLKPEQQSEEVLLKLIEIL